MTLKALTCRTHGGIFKVERRRGRPPVKCTPDNKCTRANGGQVTDRVETKRILKDARTAGTAVTVKTEYSRTDEVAAKVDANRARKAKSRQDRKTQPVSVAQNPSLPLALAAKERLTALGWEVKGKGDKDGSALITAVRGEELLTITWQDGKKVDQQYSIWDTLRPAENGHGQPGTQVKFNMEEISDKELADLLRGQKITWWNRLGGNQETAVVSAKSIKVEWIFKTDDDGHREDPTPLDRILTFVDPSGGGYRSFRLGALLKVG